MHVEFLAAREVEIEFGRLLVFVGLKMIWLNNPRNDKFPIGISLMIIGIILAVSIAISLFPPKPYLPGSSEVVRQK